MTFPMMVSRFNSWHRFGGVWSLWSALKKLRTREDGGCPAFVLRERRPPGRAERIDAG